MRRLATAEPPCGLVMIQFFAMAKSSTSHKQPLAYHDLEFLESTDARPIRILAEYLEPLRRFLMNALVWTAGRQVPQGGAVALYAGLRHHEKLAGIAALSPDADGDSDGHPDPERAKTAQQLAATKGLLLLTCGAHMNTVRMIPPLVVTAEQVDEALGIWSEVLAEV